MKDKGGFFRAKAWALRALAIVALMALPVAASAATDYVRVNQVGYLSADQKLAIAFADASLTSMSFSVVDAASGTTLWGPTAFPATSAAYAPFSNVYKLDFSAYQPASSTTCKIKLSDGTLSPSFKVGPCIYSGTEETPLNFFRAQNCGAGNWYNNGVNVSAPCHLAPGASGSTGDQDGMVVDGPNKGTTLDTEGGWHDSGDLIKFMVTLAWEVEIMEAAYRDNPGAFQDQLGANLQPSTTNGVPDILDEARYGLAWIIKMNPNATTFYYDVADGRDHNNFGTYLPPNDAIDYSVAAAPDSGKVTKPYRPVYGGANDQGGTQNCARAAGALAMAYQIWSAASPYQDLTFANSCLIHAQWLYALGKSQNAVQNDIDSFYPVSGFAPEMELAAAELYKATATASYLTDAQTYATSAGNGGGELDWAQNNFLAHYCFYPVASAAEKTTLSGYMKADLNADLALSNANPYGLGYSYVWGTLEDSTSLAVMCQLWKKLNPADTTYNAMGTANRDFLLGKNPWGVCFVQGMGTVWPNYPQHNTSLILYQKTPYGTGTASSNTAIPGLVIEGPVDYDDYASQGPPTSGSDIYGAFNNNVAGGWAYHDDNQDYTSNEPTTTGAVWAIMLFSEMAAQCSVPATPTPSNTPAGTATFTPSRTATRTASPSPSATLTASATATLTASRTATATASPTTTNSVTLTGSPSATATATFSATATVTLTQTSNGFSPTPSPTDAPPTLVLTATPTQTLAAASPTPSATASGSPSATPPQNSPTLTPSASPAASATPTFSPAASATITPVNSATVTATPSGSASPSPTQALGSPTPSYTPFAAGSTCKDVLAYYTSWSKGSGYDASKIPYDRLTHLCHAFLIPNADGTLQVPSGYIEATLIPSAHAQGVKVLASLGGSGGSTNFSALAASAAARSNFADQLKSFLLTNGYDGVDIDWEYPAASDTANLTLMVQQIRATFSATPNAHPEWLITAAVPPSYMTGNYDLANLKLVMDYFNIMTYDYAGPWSSGSGENAPLNSTMADVQKWINVKGVPASQIHFGLPFYGYKFPVGAMNSTCAGGCSAGTSLPYNQITPLISAGWTRTWDAGASSPYLIDPSGTQVLAYDDPQSIALKAAWGANNAGCAGVFIWDISLDWMGGTSQPLLDAARSVVMCGTPTVTPTLTATWTPVVHPVPGLIQAEDYAASYDTDAQNQGGAYRFEGTDIEACTDAGGGYDIGWTAAGEWMDYSINVTQPGSWDLVLRVAAPSAVSGALEILLDGVPLVASVNVPATGGWQAWADVRVPALAWPAGLHTLRIKELAGGYNFNYLDVVGPPTPTPTPTPSITVSPTVSQTPTISPGPTAQLDGPLVLDQGKPVPNPDPRALAVLLEGPVDTLTLTLYSVAYARVDSVVSGPVGRGWAQAALPPAFLLSHRPGTYYWVLEAGRGRAKAKAKALKGVMYFTR